MTLRYKLFGISGNEEEFSDALSKGRIKEVSLKISLRERTCILSDTYVIKALMVSGMSKVLLEKYKGSIPLRAGSRTWRDRHMRHAVRRVTEKGEELKKSTPELKLSTIVDGMSLTELAEFESSPDYQGSHNTRWIPNL